MDIGIRLHDTKPGTLRERLGYISAQGFACIQPAMSKVIPVFRIADAPQLLTEEPVPCGQGQMQYGAPPELVRKRALPMILENTAPENAEETRRFIEKTAATERFR